jgi:hypothetical protein
MRLLAADSASTRCSHQALALAPPGPAGGGGVRSTSASESARAGDARLLELAIVEGHPSDVVPAAALHSVHCQWQWHTGT